MFITTALLFALAATLVYVLYRLALPKPIPGIPYNESASKSILGDVQAAMASLSQTGEFWPWIAAQNVKHSSPMSQVFLRPFGKPWVVVSDFRETYDIMLHRSKEFDHSDIAKNVFLGIAPDFHIGFSMKEKRYKDHKYILQDLMRPDFLHNVAARQIYTKTENFIQLWKLKMELAQGHPFNATDDLYDTVLDFIFAVTFGDNPETRYTLAKCDSFSGLKNLLIPADMEKPVQFYSPPRLPMFDAAVTLTHSVEKTVTSPFPLLHHWILRQLPYLRRAIATKEEFFSAELDKAIDRISDNESSGRSALDEILKREQMLALKEDRAPGYKSRGIVDEIFGFVVGGHETSATNLTWGIKRLADNQHAQTALRQRLHAAYSDAVKNKRNPSVEEILEIQIPYLDATIEEILRTSLTFSCLEREALTDTVILGRHIPKGTTVVFMQIGPDFYSAPFNISEGDRSQSSREAKSRVGSWDPSDMHQFKPERWIESCDGAEVFNPKAGPHLTFGYGRRACYGKKLAYLQIRILLVMLVWNFELKKCSSELSSYRATQKLTKYAERCYVKLAPAQW